MKITIIGSGNMGSAFARQLRAAGHQVRVTGRNLAKATELARQYPGVEALAPQVRRKARTRSSSLRPTTPLRTPCALSGT